MSSTSLPRTRISLPGWSVPFDGFSEGWFETVEARERLHAAPIYQEQVAPFMSRFLDLNNSNFAAYDTPVYQVGTEPALNR